MRHVWAFWTCAWLLTGCASPPSIEPLAAPGSESDQYVVVTLRNPAGPSVPRAGSTIRSYGAPATYAVAPATRADAKAIATAHGLREVSAWPIGLLGVHCLVYQLPSAANRDEVIERLRRDRRIESAQALNSFSTLTRSGVAGDPYRSLQHNLDVMDVSGAHHWSRGEGVRVAIVDTGIDATHPDLAGRVMKRQNFVDDRRSDAHDRHGTAVAGVIAAVENNQQGIIGVAPAVRLYGLRACWPTPSNDAAASCSTLTLAKAIAAAIEARIDIVNLSLTGPADPLLARLVAIGLNRGIVFVGAIPEPSPRNDAEGSFPTSVAGVIGVDSSGGRSSADSALFAPGKEVLTLVPDGRYDFLSGSSLAAASVSGGIALLLARDKKLRAEEARDILARSSRSVSTDRGVLASVNLCAALATVVRESTCVTPEETKASSQSR